MTAAARPYKKSNTPLNILSPPPLSHSFKGGVVRIGGKNTVIDIGGGYATSDTRAR